MLWKRCGFTGFCVVRARQVATIHHLYTLQTRQSDASESQAHAPKLSSATINTPLSCLNAVKAALCLRICTKKTMIFVPAEASTLRQVQRQFCS
jgi:hypothetical protein